MNNKGISELVSYVLLIVLAIGLAGGVFVWLRYIAVPPQVNQCDKISLDLFNCTCYLNPDLSGNLSFWLKNRDNFNIFSLKILVSNTSNLSRTYDFYVRNPDSGKQNAYLSWLNASNTDTSNTAYIYGDFYDIGSVKSIKITPFRYIGGNQTACIPNEFLVDCCLSGGSPGRGSGE